tara:strand:- start:222 stop:524 length:303 start_codon:yes stop_codon:yes gene_type:complete
MALQMSISKYGFTANNAYHVIESVRYNKRLITPIVTTGEKNASISLLSYADADARTAGDEPMKQQNYQFDLATGSDAEDILTQAYAHLKTLDEFSDATDV